MTELEKELEKDLLNDFLGEKKEPLPQFKVDIYELHNFETAYDYPVEYTDFHFTLQLYKTLLVADVGNFEKLAALYPETAYMVAFKEKPQFLHYFILWDRIREKEVDGWR